MMKDILASFWSVNSRYIYIYADKITLTRIDVFWKLSDTRTLSRYYLSTKLGGGIAVLHTGRIYHTTALRKMRDRAIRAVGYPEVLV